MPQGFQNMLALNVANRQKNQDNFNEMISAGLYSLTDGMLGSRTQAAVKQDKINYVQTVQNNILTASQSGDQNKFIEAIKMGAVQLRDIDPEGSQALMDMYSKFQTTEATAPKAPETRTLNDGKETITQQWNPNTQQWVEIARGPRWTDKSTPPQMGTIPTGYQLIEDNGAWKLELIPGGPADQENAEIAEADNNKKILAKRSISVVKENIQDALRFYKLSEGEDSDISDSAFGISGSLIRNIPSTNAKDLHMVVETIKANIGFDRLQQMREASPTGGALGQVAIQELFSLQASLGNLSIDQSPEQFKKTLLSIGKRYDNMLKIIDGEMPSEEDLRGSDPLNIGI